MEVRGRHPRPAALSLPSILKCLSASRKAIRQKVDGFAVSLTNGESSIEFDKLDGVSKMWSPRSKRVQLRGGPNNRCLWSSEQMICQRGTRARQTRTATDNAWCSYSQVVHKVGHAIDMNYGGGRLIDLKVVNGTINPYLKSNLKRRLVGQHAEVIAWDFERLVGTCKIEGPVLAARLEFMSSLFPGGTASILYDAAKPISR